MHVDCIGMRAISMGRILAHNIGCAIRHPTSWPSTFMGCPSSQGFIAHNVKVSVQSQCKMHQENHPRIRFLHRQCADQKYGTSAFLQTILVFEDALVRVYKESLSHNAVQKWHHGVINLIPHTLIPRSFEHHSRKPVIFPDNSNLFIQVLAAIACTKCILKQ